jgi:hypothetical protein
MMRGTMLGVRALSLLAVAFLLLALAPPAHAVPRMTMLSGTPCSTCHVNVQGGGMRTETGWGSMALVGAATWGDLSFDWLDTRESNEFAPRSAFGFDHRFQMARVGRPTVTINNQGQPDAALPDREFFPMQIQPYLSFRPLDWLTLYGTWAATRETFNEGEACSEDYPGQSCFEAQAIFATGPGLPTIRVGRLQPSVGIRHDDHTALIRSDVGRPLIPAAYAEWGGEVSWQPVYWLQADAGAYSARQISRSIGDLAVVDSSDVLASGRVRFSPMFGLGERQALTTWMGGSILAAGKFWLYSGFWGVGLRDRVSTIFELAHSYRGADQNRTTTNLSLMTNLRIVNWLFGHVRLERSASEFRDSPATVRSVVAGFEFFPLPYIEVRPEYRYTRADDWEMGQYTVQLHLFY